MADASDHRSRESTERAGYDRMREAGLPPDAARRVAREASEQVHRGLDRARPADPKGRR